MNGAIKIKAFSHTSEISYMQRKEDCMMAVNEIQPRQKKMVELYSNKVMNRPTPVFKETRTPAQQEFNSKYKPFQNVFSTNTTLS